MRCTKYNVHFDSDVDESDWWKLNRPKECSIGCLKCKRRLRDSEHDSKSLPRNKLRGMRG